MIAKKGFTNRLKDVHEYKEAKRRIATLNAQTSLKSRVKHNLDKQIKTAQKDKKDAEKSRDQANVQKKQAETARDNVKNDLIDVISRRDSAQIELADIQAQAEALANWNIKKEEEKKKFEEKLKKEKALQEREKTVAEREKNVASNYNAFNKMFQQFKENYMLSGLQEMSDAELENENRFDLAYDFATTTDTKSAKQFESFVFDNHPARKIKAFMKAIANAFGHVDSINTAVLNQKEFIDEYEKENKQQRQMQTHQSNKQQENDIDDDLQ